MSSKYAAYKATGIPWIGEVPEHWEVKQFKYIFREHGGNGFPHEDQGVEEGELPFFKVGDLSGRGKGVARTSNWTSRANAQARNWNVVPKGAIISPKIGESLRKNNRKLALVDCLIDNNCVAHEPIDADGEYAFFLLSLIDFDWYVNPGAVPSVSLSKLRGSTIAVPPLTEQTHIARYLSHKTALIDAYLARKRRMMALLKEQRQALISQAVTKGLDPNAPMKDSGVEWIGEVPEHWEVSRVKHMCSVRGRIGFRGYEKDDLVEPGEGALVIGGKHIGDDRLELSDPVYLSWAKYHESPEIMIEQGDIVVTQRGSLGKVAVIDQALGPATINPSMILLKEIGCDPSFFGYFFKSAFFKSYIDLINTSTAVPMISQDQLGNISVPLPPLEEQLVIVQSLNDKLNLIDDELTRIQASMKRVQEYRQALISAVVTGKVDVRGVEVPEEDEMIGRSDDQMMAEETRLEELDITAAEV